MDITVIIFAISKMAIMIILGAIISLRVNVTAEAKRLLMTIIINLAVPAIILNGIFHTEINSFLLQNMFLVMALSIGFNIGGLILALLISRVFGIKGVLARKIALISTFGNTAFIGIPLCATLFGPIGGLLAALFDSGLDLVLFTVGILLLQKEEKFSFKQLKVLINMPIIAICIGLSSAYLGIKPPTMVKEITASLAGVATPLAMLYIGILFPGLLKEKKRTPLPTITLSLSLKLLIFPILFALCLSFFPLPEAVRQVVVIQAAMPTFMLASVLLSLYTNDEEMGVVATLYSAFLSLLTIPAVLAIIAYIT